MIRILGHLFGRSQLIALNLNQRTLSAAEFIEQYIEPHRALWERWANEEDRKVIEAYIALGEDSSNTPVNIVP